MRISTTTSDTLRSASGRRISLQEIQNCDLGFYDPGGSFWMYALPDRIRTLPPVAYDRFKGAPSAEGKDIVLYGDYLPQRQTLRLSNEDAPAKPTPLLYFDSQHFFIPAVIPFSLEHFRPTSGLIVWVQIDLLTALKKMQESAYIEPLESIRNAPRLSTYYGSVANLVRLDHKTFGLGSTVELSQAPAFELPIISAVDQTTAAFPGLDVLLSDEELEGATILKTVSSGIDPADEDAFGLFEAALTNGEWQAAATVLREQIKAWTTSARAQYAIGCLYESLDNHSAASEAFFQAQRLDHFAAMDKLLAAQSREAKPFRDAFPEVFDLIRRGDRLRALTTLRGVCDDYPMVGNAILSYCLRGIHEPQEGLTVCEKTLSLNPYQTDVLGNMWSFLLELESDKEGLDIARHHVTSFPQDLSAISNLIDSSLLVGDIDAALLLVHRYFILTTNLQHVVKLLFKVYERAELWRELIIILDELFPLISGPTAETLCLYGEALIENQRFDQCRAVFDQALTAEPGNASVILGYARALARADQENEALQLLQTALIDPNRIDSEQDRIFLLTLLAEIQRRTGAPDAAIESFHTELGEDPVAASIPFGPLPALEYAESLLILGKREQVVEIVLKLREVWPGDPFVNELAEIVGLS